MPRRRTPVVLPTSSLVAASTRYAGKVTRIYQPEKSWQKECYRHYLICGEARYAAKFFGNAVSRAVLFATDSEGVPFTTGPADEAMDAMFSGPNGQKQILEALGQHLTIAGECYLVGRDVDGNETWEVVSVLELRSVGDRWYIDYGDGKQIDLTDDDAIIRVWVPNPSRHIEADSPFRTMLPILREIEWLTRHVFAQISSRLAGAGILFLPQGVSFPPPPGVDGKTEPLNEADAFMQMLGDAMLAPIDDPGSPASLVPSVATVPGDQIDSIKLLHFWTDLDAASKDMRSEAIRRFALGMDLPPEEILGMGSNPGTGGGTSNGVSHWGAWQIEESTIKMHVEPMLDMIVNALTVSYLRVLFPDTTDLVGYTTEKLRLRPDRSREAIELYQLGLIKGEVVVTENGFAVEEMMDEVERREWLLLKIASGSATPEQVQAALAALGVMLNTGPPQGNVRPTPPPPSLDQHPRRPRTPAESALIAASEGLVFRALERAGNRLRQSVGKPPGVPSYETHCHVQVNGNAPKLLDDAWSCAAQVLDGIADPGSIVPVLDSYCLTLINEGSPHTRERLVDWLQLATEVTA